MKRYLPTLLRPAQYKRLSVNTSKGFTLIELMVVIAIIAILSVVGIALFTSTQGKARDTKRIQDITAMSKAMEVNYVVGTGYQTVVSSTWFSDQQVPTNPGPNGADYTFLGPAGTGAITAAGYTFCATLENSTGNATDATGAGLGTTTGGGFFCKKNSQ